MYVNKNGEIVRQEWITTFGKRYELKLDEFCIMPNHFHAIVRIVDAVCEGNANWGKDLRHDDSGTIAHNNGGAIAHDDGGAIAHDDGRDVARYVSTEPAINHNNQRTIVKISPKPKSLPTIIRSFKSAVTNKMHVVGFVGNVWQSRFHDHIIRNDRELFAIRQYIKNNPLNWGNDQNVIETTMLKTGKQPWFVYMG
jgi:REP element-mobilizing transposase RayT